MSGKSVIAKQHVVAVQVGDIEATVHFSVEADGFISVEAVSPQSCEAEVIEILEDWGVV